MLTWHVGVAKCCKVALLFERGRTLEWADLPDRLWAATGHRLKGTNCSVQAVRAPAEHYDEDSADYLYLVTALTQNELLFLVAPEAAACADEWKVRCNDLSPRYRAELRPRIAAALQGRKRIAKRFQR